jgi:hypothetical protein
MITFRSAQEWWTYARKTQHHQKNPAQTKKQAKQLSTWAIMGRTNRIFRTFRFSRPACVATCAEPITDCEVRVNLLVDHFFHYNHCSVPHHIPYIPTQRASGGQLLTEMDARLQQLAELEKIFQEFYDPFLSNQRKTQLGMVLHSSHN